MTYEEVMQRIDKIYEDIWERLEADLFECGRPTEEEMLAIREKHEQYREEARGKGAAWFAAVANGKTPPGTIVHRKDADGSLHRVQ